MRCKKIAAVFFQLQLRCVRRYESKRRKTVKRSFKASVTQNWLAIPIRSLGKNFYSLTGTIVQIDLRQSGKEGACTKNLLVIALIASIFPGHKTFTFLHQYIWKGATFTLWLNGLCFLLAFHCSQFGSGSSWQMCATVKLLVTKAITGRFSVQHLYLLSDQFHLATSSNHSPTSQGIHISSISLSLPEGKLSL